MSTHRIDRWVGEPAKRNRSEEPWCGARGARGHKRTELPASVSCKECLRLMADYPDGLDAPVHYALVTP